MSIWLKVDWLLQGPPPFTICLKEMGILYSGVSGLDHDLKKATFFTKGLLPFIMISMMGR
ncbi:hypothetical protein MOTE_15130 [Moorella thermoacetica]|uniref:Uncharacterized protein n=1 Tax=Neomoorella thermoacetica TaxID=1525 RepID=A0A1J5NJ54_NEOTH|nr:hypothetical protein MOTE_15130 [Moorella thermoacetica]